MLVLTRKRRQTIRLKIDEAMLAALAQGEVVIRVCEIRRDSVRIGIEASKAVTVVRGELVFVPTREQPP